MEVAAAIVRATPGVFLRIHANRLRCAEAFVASQIYFSSNKQCGIVVAGSKHPSE